MEEENIFLNFVPPTVPKDEEGFVKSFELSDTSGIQNFFDTYGFVVVRDVLDDQQITATLDEFWSYPNLNKNDPRTWEEFYNKQRFGHMGIIGLWCDFKSVRQLENRQNERVYGAFATILKSRELWVDHDRLGIMRPTVNVVYPGKKEPVDKPEWRTLENWLHMDCNPAGGFASIGSFSDDRSPIDFSKTVIIQGLITLSDAREEDGGFHCVPGAHKHTIEWSTKIRSKHNNNIQVPEDDPVRTKIQKIAVRRGCLLTWTSLLPHGNHPNMSDKWRAVQYIRMMPITGTPYSPLIGKEYRVTLPTEFKITSLGEKLFGFKSWDVEPQEVEMGWSNCIVN